MGVGIARVVANYAHWPTVVTASSLFLGIGVSMAVGILSGMYPAVPGLAGRSDLRASIRLSGPVRAGYGTGRGLNTPTLRGQEGFGLGQGHDKGTNVKATGCKGGVGFVN